MKDPTMKDQTLKDPTLQPAADTASDQTRELAVRRATQRGSLHDTKLRRLQEYQANSLKNTDPLEANLGSQNSMLMYIGNWVGESITQAIESGPQDIKRLPELLPAIDALLRVNRQVERYTNLLQRAAEARKPKTVNKQHDALCVDAESETNSSQSEESTV